MDAETILLAKKFSGGADVSAAKEYMQAAQAAASQAASAAAGIPNNISSTLQTLTNDMAALEAQVAGIETSGVNVSGNVGDTVRIGQNGTLVAGDRPVTQIMDVMVPLSIQNDTSGVTWIADVNDNIAGFVITADTTGKTIDSYNHDTYLLMVTNVVNTITNEGMDARTVIMDVDYVNGSSAEKALRTSKLYNTIPYATTRQIDATVGVNAAGCAYLDVRCGTGMENWQYFPAIDVSSFERRYQNNIGTDHVKAVSFILQGATLRKGTRIILWKA